jgi:hypothetical protein
MEHLLKFKGPLLKYKFKIEKTKVQLKTFNIHISHKKQFAVISMPLKWHHIGIFFLNTILNTT